MNANFLAILIAEYEMFCKEKGGSLKDFAFWLLQKQEIKEVTNFNEEDVQIKIVDLSRALEIQAKSFPNDDPVDIIQTVRLLSIVETLKNPIKQEVVDSSLMETSTGFYVLKDLVKKSYLQELPIDDRRASALALTKKGKAFLQTKRGDLRKISITSVLNSVAEKRSFIKMLNKIHRHQINKMELKK